MYLIKKLSKAGKSYYVLVVLNGFKNDGVDSKSYVNLTEQQGDLFIVKYCLKVFDDKK